MGLCRALYGGIHGAIALMSDMLSNSAWKQSGII